MHPVDVTNEAKIPETARRPEAVPEVVPGGAHDVVDALVLDLLEWVAAGERSYAEVMDAWRTSCPRLTVWEDATDRGLVARALVEGRALVRVTPAGRALLARRRR
jgi:hypothetical protein